MDPVLLFVVVFFLVLIIGVIKTESSARPIRRMNAGARLYQEKRYAEAEAHFQQLLTKRLPPGVEADTRRRLADTLDVLGKPDEAADERKRIEAIIAVHPKDAKSQQARGDLLKRQHQCDEACEAYMSALGKTPFSNRSARAIIMAKLAIANYEAARPDETVRWAACSLASLPSPNIRRSMECMSGAAYSDQGDLENAEQHYRNALRLSEISSNSQHIAQDLGILAGIQYKQGQFEEAITACRKARQAAEDPSRASYTVEVECLGDMGRFDEARAVMAQHRLGAKFDQPHLERRMQSLAALGSAFIETRAGQPEAALAFLEQAREGFVGEASPETSWPPAPQKGDDKLLLWCDATKALALAQKKDARASRLLAESVLSRLPLFAEDRNTKVGVYSNLSRAAFVLGDLAECQELSHCYLECKPNPCGLPSAYYWLGETYLRLAETDAARDAFRQAVAPGIDSLDAHRAQARLNEMAG